VLSDQPVSQAQLSFVLLFLSHSGYQETRSRNGAVQHLEGQEAVLMGEAETLYDASGEVLQGSGCRPLRQILVAAVEPATKTIQLGSDLVGYLLCVRLFEQGRPEFRRVGTMEMDEATFEGWEFVVDDDVLPFAEMPETESGRERRVNGSWIVCASALFRTGH
jgi:hypothetical protein